MFLEIKKRIEKSIHAYLNEVNATYKLREISPVLYRNIKEFISRKGKRIRPTLFVVGYLGFTDKPAPKLYRSAVSIELLHDFMLVHDDIIDKSDTRRGKPSMHAMMQEYLKGYADIKFNGADLTIVVGDIMYAMALDAFLAIKEDKRRKELALKKLIEAAFYTGSGEFIELLLSTKEIEEIEKSDIYRIYDLKTANYTFAAPLTMGAILGGAGEKEIQRLSSYGIYLGRAFQIKDDIIGTFGEESETGKSNVTDLQEAKKTLLVWYAYNHSGRKNKALIKNTFSKGKVNKNDLLIMRRIISDSGALEYARSEIKRLGELAVDTLRHSSIKKRYKKSLSSFSKEILAL